MSLRIDGVTRSFGQVRALDQVSLTVPAGTITVVVGPSGGGKTTLLRLLAGLDSPDAGEVSIDGQPVTLGATALCFQDAPLYPHLTVAENVAFPLRLRANRRPHPEVADRVGRVLDMLHIGHLASRRVSGLSGGQRQRVGIARALVREVQVYLFDEPMAHLDEQLARGIVTDLRRIQRDLGLTFVYVTHSRQEAFALADQMVLLHGGRVVQAGAPRELVDAPVDLFVAGFLGRAELNVDKQGDQVTATRPEEVTVTPDPGGTPVEEAVYLGPGWLIRTATGSGVSEVPFAPGETVRLQARRVFTFPA